MRSKRYIAAGIVVPVIILALASLAAALPPAGISGLTVSLTAEDGTVLGPVTTDDYGAFIIEGALFGTYTLGIVDAAGTMDLKFQLLVPVEKAPADIAGMVYGWSETDVAVKVLARVVSQDSADDLQLEAVRLRPKRWNLNFARSNGKIKVKMLGYTLDAITQVTLQTTAGYIATTEIKYDEEEGVAMASFTKSAVFEAIIPETTKRGDLVPVDVVVEASGMQQTYSKTVLIRGRRGR